MAGLVLGPLIRHVGETDATIWVETDARCQVEMLGQRSSTFHVEGHHYALVLVDGLTPGTLYEYDVKLDGEQVWPQQGVPPRPSAFRTIDPGRRRKLLFGSCRVALPHEPPFTLPREDDSRGRGVDALRTYAERMLVDPPDEWPELLVLVGDQVYADEVSPLTLDFIRSRRSTRGGSGEEVADFEEYTRLYRESWQEPTVRWLLSTVPSAMLFDDHDVRDDWNISQAWVERMRAKPWWEERIVAAFMSYWLYQHLGNLSPRELSENHLLARLRAADDGGPLLREFARRADREAEGVRWSFVRDFGRTRLLGIDCRAGRVLTDEERSIVDDDEWRWLVEHTSGDFDHLLLALSDPFLLAPGAHHFQAWNEAVCAGVWGKTCALVGERIREAVDLDHWASFRHSFERMTDLLRTVGSGRHGSTPPASIVALSGDVHHAYLAQVRFPSSARVRSRVYQAVCSPLRNPLDAKERRTLAFMGSRAGELSGRALAATAGVKPPSIRWRFIEGPSFHNQVASLVLDGRHAHLTIEKAIHAGRSSRLQQVFDHQLS